MATGVEESVNFDWPPQIHLNPLDYIGLRLDDRVPTHLRPRGFLAPGLRSSNASFEQSEPPSTLTNHLIIQRLFFLLQRRLTPLQKSPPLGHSRIGIKLPVRPVERSEHRRQLVILLRADRIELVIVTARTLNRGAVEGVHHRSHHIISIEQASDLAIRLRLRDLGMADQVPRPSRDESGGRDAIFGIRPEHIARDLFPNEARIGLVRIQGSDHVIPIRPRVGTRLILVIAMGLTVVDHIQPMARPTLTVARRRQQPFHTLLIRIRRRIVQEGIHLGRRRRQPCQIETHPTQQRAPIGLRRWRNPLTMQAI